MEGVMPLGNFYRNGPEVFSSRWLPQVIEQDISCYAEECTNKYFIHFRGT